MKALPEIGMSIETLEPPPPAKKIPLGDNQILYLILFTFFFSFFGFVFL